MSFIAFAAVAPALAIGVVPLISVDKKTLSTASAIPARRDCSNKPGAELNRSKSSDTATSVAALRADNVPLPNEIELTLFAAPSPAAAAVASAVVTLNVTCKGTWWASANTESKKHSSECCKTLGQNSERRVPVIG